jgi:hypothetical protein
MPAPPRRPPVRTAPAVEAPPVVVPDPVQAAIAAARSGGAPIVPAVPPPPPPDPQVEIPAHITVRPGGHLIDADGKPLTVGELWADSGPASPTVVATVTAYVRKSLMGSVAGFTAVQVVRAGAVYLKSDPLVLGTGAVAVVAGGPS